MKTNMFKHEPPNYICPFCRLLSGIDTEQNNQQDIVYRNKHATAIIAPTQWEDNKGHVLVFPNEHHENIYEIPDIELAEVYKVVKRVALAIRSIYDCQGTSTRQHNEPAGDQDLWHFHVHVFPRSANDNLYKKHDQKRFIDAKHRLINAKKLRKFFEMDRIVQP